MPIPNYGAAPLSATFLGIRVAQVALLIIILALSGSFVNNMLMLNVEPSKEVVGTLVITSLVTLYTVVSIAFYWSKANIGLFVMASLDFLILLAWVVVSVCIGRPISFINCYHPPGLNGELIWQNIIDNSKATLGSLLQNGPLPIAVWSGMTKSNCHATKAIWGFSIALAILYATSTILLPTLHFKNKKVGGYSKSVV